MKMASTSPSLAMSLAVITPVVRSTPRPRNAMAVESRPRKPADPQSATIPTNVIATIHSARESGPSASSALRAAAGASGVDETSGLIARCSSHGNVNIATSVGTDEASSHDPNVISTPALRASAAPSGLPAIAVNHSVDERLMLTMPENIRYPPSLRRSGLSGDAPPASARPATSGYKTPARAVLLGNAGAITPSTRKMLYDSPSVDRPNQLTTR